ncbi:MAG: hypothetical protein WA125_16890 [Desulfosporosinus sp.]
MFRNLRAELARLDDTNGKVVAEAIGITAQAFYDKMSGRSEFKRKEMVKIRNTFFKGMTLDYLFECEDDFEKAG